MKRKLLTQKEAVQLCRELWTWLSHHGTKDKEDWPRWEHNGGNVRGCYNWCPLCEYNVTHTRNYCIEGCLLKWSGGGSSGCLFGEYGDWKIAINCPGARRRIAKKIANLPINPNRGRGDSQ